MGKLHVPEHIVNLYTDVLAHTFEPKGNGIACGTTTGRFVVLEQSKNDFNHRITSTIPSGDAVLGLDWATCGILVGVKNGFYTFPVKESTGMISENPLFTDCLGSSVMDIRMLPGGKLIAAGCDDGKIRLFDPQTSKLIRTIDSGRESWDRLPAAVEVLAVSDDYFASGSQDGRICVFDKDLRSPESIWNLSVGSKLAPGLAISPDSTWLAAGTQGVPTVYNFRIREPVPMQTDSIFMTSKSPLPIYSMTFDQDGTLWWGGGGSQIFGSDNLERISSSFHTSYGDEIIYHIYSITTGTDGQISVSGSSNGILYTDNGKYWDTFITL